MFAKVPQIHPVNAHLKMPQIALTLTSPSASPQASGIPMVAQNNPIAARANETNLRWKIFRKKTYPPLYRCFQSIPKMKRKNDRWNERISPFNLEKSQNKSYAKNDGRKGTSHKNHNDPTSFQVEDVPCPNQLPHRSSHHPIVVHLGHTLQVL